MKTFSSFYSSLLTSQRPSLLFISKILGFTKNGIGKAFAFVLLTCFIGSASAQDTLHFRDGKTQVVKVIDASKTYVRYTPWPAVENGPVTTTGSNAIEQVRYRNGTTLNLIYRQVEYTMDSIPDPISFIALDVLDLAYPQAITIVYQRPIGKTDLSFRLGASTSIHYLISREVNASDFYYYYDYHYSTERIFEVSAELLSDNRYSRGWYGGVGLDYGMVNVTGEVYYGAQPSRDTTLYNIPYGTFYTTGGYYRNFASGLVIGASANLGLSMQKYISFYGGYYDLPDIYSYNHLILVTRFNFILGYKLKL